MRDERIQECPRMGSSHRIGHTTIWEIKSNLGKAALGVKKSISDIRKDIGAGACEAFVELLFKKEKAET
jgi:hypothetical protein